jgi:hypothetical protein
MTSALVSGWAMQREWQWRRWRVPLALIALIIVAGAVLGSLQPRQSLSNEYLNPAGSSPVSSNALADILGERGLTVTAVYSTASALAAVRSSAQAPVTLMITAPDLLPRRARRWPGRRPTYLVRPQARGTTGTRPARVSGELNAASNTARCAGLLARAAQLAGSVSWLAHCRFHKHRDRLLPDGHFPRSCGT